MRNMYCEPEYAVDCEPELRDLVPDHEVEEIERRIDGEWCSEASPEDIGDIEKKYLKLAKA